MFKILAISSYEAKRFLGFRSNFANVRRTLVPNQMLNLPLRFILEHYFKILIILDTRDYIELKTFLK